MSLMYALEKAARDRKRVRDEYKVELARSEEGMNEVQLTQRGHRLKHAARKVDDAEIVFQKIKQNILIYINKLEIDGD